MQKILIANNPLSKKIFLKHKPYFKIFTIINMRISRFQVTGSLGVYKIAT